MAGNKSLSMGNWIAVAGLVLAVLGAGGGIALQVFATKTDLAAAERQLETRVVVNEQENTYQTQEIHRVHLRVEDMDNRQRVDSRNIEKLLERFRVEPEPRPESSPAPKPVSPPSPASAVSP